MADFSRLITTIDSHTTGEGTRLVTGGLPPIPGETMAAKLLWARDQLSWLPGFLLLEPRGHKDLFGAILTDPCTAEADLGVIFMDNQAFEPMCGHAVIGTVTTLLETGVFEMSEPETSLVLDTPAGLVRAQALIQGGKVVAVSFENVPSFVYHSDLRVKVPGLGELTVDIVFGGLFFVFVKAEQVGVKLVPENAGRLADMGMHILAAVNKRIQVRHPELPHIDRIIDLRFYVEPGYDGSDSRNVVVLGNRMVDRSPCGTGTSAETALRYTQGRLRTGESFETESIIGTRFKGEAMSEVKVGGGEESFQAVIPRVTGSAHITGFHQFTLDESDPFPEGFFVGV